MFDELAEKFDTETVYEAELLPVVDEPVTVVPLHTPEIEDDHAVAHQKISAALDVGISALHRLAEITAESEHPRAYEVLGQLIKTVAETSKDLLDLHKMRSEAERKAAVAAVASGKAVGNVTNNNVFVGSTHELMQMLKGAKVDESSTTPLEDK